MEVNGSLVIHFYFLLLEKMKTVIVCFEDVKDKLQRKSQCTVYMCARVVETGRAFTEMDAFSICKPALLVETVSIIATFIFEKCVGVLIDAELPMRQQVRNILRTCIFKTTTTFVGSQIKINLSFRNNGYRSNWTRSMLTVTIC